MPELARSKNGSGSSSRRSPMSSSTPSPERTDPEMKLCMFTPKEAALERGWPGRIDGDEVVQLAAQTLQAFFTGGGGAREHARYPLADVEFRPPVLNPPSI